ALGPTREGTERDRDSRRRARAIAEALGDDARLAGVLYWLGRLEYVLWNPSAAIDYARRSLDVGERLGDDAIVAPPVNLLGRIYWKQAQLTRGAPILERSDGRMPPRRNK